MISLQSVLALFGGFVLHLTLGAAYTFGNICPYIISYFYIYGIESDITANDAIWVLSATAVGQGISMSIGGLVHNYLGPRITTFIGSFFASAGVAVSYYTIKLSLVSLALTYGFVFGVGVGLAYTSPMTAGMKWFPNNKGLVNGIIVGGFAAGTAIFTQVQTKYLNPNNSGINKQGYFTDQQVINNVPSLFLLLGGIYATLQLIGCSMLTLPEKSKEEVTDITSTTDKASTIDRTSSTDVVFSSGSEEKVIKSDSSSRIISKSEITPSRSFTPNQMVHCHQFYILWFTLFFNIQSFSYIISMMKSYGQIFIKDDQFLTMICSISAVCSAFGRIIWGLFIDRFNYKVKLTLHQLICMFALTIGLCIFLSTLPLTPSGGKFMYPLWIWFIFFMLSGNFTLFPTCTTQLFGIEHAGINYGLIFSSTIFAAPLAAILTQNLSPLIGENGVIGIFAGFTVISFLLTLFFKELKHCN